MSDSAAGISSYLPEQRFFSDPALDRLMAVTMTLAAEVYVLRERIESLESRMDTAEDKDGSTESRDAVDQRRGEDAAAFVRHLLTPLLGEQQSKGLQ